MLVINAGNSCSPLCVLLLDHLRALFAPPAQPALLLTHYTVNIYSTSHIHPQLLSFASDSKVCLSNFTSFNSNLEVCFTSNCIKYSYGTNIHPHISHWQWHCSTFPSLTAHFPPLIVGNNKIDQPPNTLWIGAQSRENIYWWWWRCWRWQWWWRWWWWWLWE